MPQKDLPLEYLDLLQSARDFVREKGFVTTLDICIYLIVDKKISSNQIVMDIIESVPCENIKMISYQNSVCVQSGYTKTLYYFLMEPEIKARRE